MTERTIGDRATRATRALGVVAIDLNLAADKLAKGARNLLDSKGTRQGYAELDALARDTLCALVDVSNRLYNIRVSYSKSLEG